MDQNCAYCMKGELVAKFGYPIGQMKSGYLYLFKEQSKAGRVLLAYKDHVSEMIDISDSDRADLGTICTCRWQPVSPYKP